MGGELAAGVLGDVGELVAQQAISGFGTGCELVTGEVDVMPDGEGLGADQLGGFGGGLVGVDAHVIECDGRAGAGEGRGHAGGELTGQRRAVVGGAEDRKGRARGGRERPRAIGRRDRVRRGGRWGSPSKAREPRLG